MFDAKSILDQLMRGNTPQQPGASSGGGLEEILRNLLPGTNQPAPQGRDTGDTAQGPSGNPLGDLLSKLQQGQGAGSITDILGQVFGQAKSGVREGAGRIDDATGASARARDALSQLSGRSPDELIAQIKQLIANNQLGTGAALGGLGALLLGTGAGRGLAASAVKLGGLALIGGLAYKAYMNHQQGLSPMTGQPKPGAQPQALLAAPEGSGFEADATSNEQAMVLIRAMIAAAAADGRVDAVEQKKIMSSLSQAQLNGEARQFLANQLEHPATADDLAEASTSPEDAARIYTAARLAVDVDTNEEHEFLAELADRLGIDADLAAHIDASARTAGA